MSRTLRAFTAILVAAPLWSQAPTVPSDEGVLERGVGVLWSAAGEEALPFALTVHGPLVALRPVVGLLDGELVVGPLQQGHTLKVADQEMILGPDSAVMTSGEEIIYLSQAPRIGATGLQVPIDLLERTFGDLLGFEFSWLDEEPRLEVPRLLVSRRPLRTLPVEVEVVHFQGLTTLALSFAEKPRWRFERAEGEVVVELLGDRLIPGRPDVREDPLVRRVDVESSRIRVRLAPEALAVQHHVVQRDPRFQIVFEIFETEVSDSPKGLAAGLGRPSRPGREMKIVIDPGHGGEERGAIGRSGSEEKDLTLLLARTLKRQLERRLPVRVVLTRTADRLLSHESRTAIANQNRADLFISLHLNSEVGTSARGAETFFLSAEASDERAASAAEFENRGITSAPAASDGDDYGLHLILWDLAQTRYLAESQRLANLIQQELNETLEIPDRGVKQAPFRVLMGATMPAVLVELGFLSNPEEEALLETPSYRSSLVSALVRAVVRYRAQLAASEGSLVGQLP